MAKTDLRKARGPLTLLAFLLLLSGVLLYLKVSPNKNIALDESSPTAGTFPSLGVPLATTTPPPSVTTPVTAPPSSSVPTTVVTPGETTTLPITVPTTLTQVTTSTTTPLAPIKWRNVLPPIPAGGSASLVADNGDRYAANITYASLSSTEVVTQMSDRFESSGWSVTLTTQGSVSSIVVTKTGIQGTVKVSPSDQGTLAELDLRRAS